MFKDRMLVMNDMKNNEMVGTYYSNDYVMRNILKMTDIQIKEEQGKIAQEKADAEQSEQPPENGEEGDNDDGQF